MILTILSVVLFCLFVLYRNRWTHDNLTKLNYFDDNHNHVIKNYLTYDQIFLRFWIWDIEKLKKDRKWPIY
jgi:hypothetical protein